MPTMKTVKARATRTAMRRAAIRENMKTVIVKVMKRRRGRPVRVIWERRNAWVVVSLLFLFNWDPMVGEDVQRIWGSRRRMLGSLRVRLLAFLVGKLH